jgi:hypothetical protein
MYLIIKSRASVVHYFTEWMNCENAFVLLNMKSLFPKIIVERYDTVSGFYLGLKPSVYRYEEKIMEMADGLCLREDIREYLEKERHLNVTQNTVWIQDCYEEECMVTERKERPDGLSPLMGFSHPAAVFL